MGILHDVTVNMKLGVDRSTAKMCLAMVELYLNQNDTECLVIENNEPGCWNLAIKDWKEIEDEKY